jgi:hypothetical protein
MKKPKLTATEIDELVVRDADDDSAWGPPIYVPAKPWAQRVAVRHLDLAAKFHVLSVLYRLGAEATVSAGSQKDVDIAVVHKPGEVFTIDVKVAHDAKSWRIDDFPVDRTHFVVFVYFSGRTSVAQSMPKSYVLNSRVLHSWAKEHDGLIEAKELFKTAQDAREAWDRLLPAA